MMFFFLDYVKVCLSCEIARARDDSFGFSFLVSRDLGPSILESPYSY
jgi:hypothetical protein